MKELFLYNTAYITLFFLYVNKNLRNWYLIYFYYKLGIIYYMNKISITYLLITINLTFDKLISS